MKRMDRSLTASSPSGPKFLQSVDMARCEAVTAANHALFGPLHYEANYAYPLLVWLHGAGDSERQLPRVMPMVSMRNFVAVAPRGATTVATGQQRQGYGWDSSQAGVQAAGQRVTDCIEAAEERFHVAARRIFLAGYGTGGSMALRLALLDPYRFAGAASLGGPFPSGHCPLRRLDEARRVPLLVTTSRDSTRYTPQQVANDLRLLHSAGMALTLRQYPCGDELTAGMLGDLNRWLMAQVCPS
jgi:phospholipase/carboxylesterase